MEFTSLVEGVAAFASDQQDKKIPAYEQQSYAGVGQILTLNSNSQSIDGSVLPTVMTTLGGIIRSMQPVQFDDLTVGLGPTKSTRDNVMIGGNGGIEDALNPMASFLSSTFAGSNSPFNSAYQHATNSALNQAQSGMNFLNNAVITTGGLVGAASRVSGMVSQSFNGITKLADAVSGGRFSSSGLGRSLQQTRRSIQTSSAQVNRVSNSVHQVNRSVNYATRQSGSLLNLRV